jgi:glycosyltransferase involved in cell wall biosynthesis
MLGSLSRSELAAQLAQAAIYALPARYEPFGLSVLEAASSGCALVLGRIPSLLENWSDAACFVDPNDPGELARAIRELSTDAARRQRLSQRSRLRASAFSAARMAEEYLRLYTEVSAGSEQPELVKCAS